MRADAQPLPAARRPLASGLRASGGIMLAAFFHPYNPRREPYVSQIRPLDSAHGRRAPTHTTLRRHARARERRPPDHLRGLLLLRLRHATRRRRLPRLLAHTRPRDRPEELRRRLPRRGPPARRRRRLAVLPHAAALLRPRRHGRDLPHAAHRHRHLHVQIHLRARRPHAQHHPARSRLDGPPRHRTRQPRRPPPPRLRQRRHRPGNLPRIRRRLRRLLRRPRRQIPGPNRPHLLAPVILSVTVTGSITLPLRQAYASNRARQAYASKMYGCRCPESERG